MDLTPIADLILGFLVGRPVQFGVANQNSYGRAAPYSPPPSALGIPGWQNGRALRLAGLSLRKGKWGMTPAESKCGKGIFPHGVSPQRLRPQESDAACALRLQKSAGRGEIAIDLASRLGGNWPAPRRDLDRARRRLFRTRRLRDNSADSPWPSRLDPPPADPSDDEDPPIPPCLWA